MIKGIASEGGAGVCASAIPHENNNPNIKAQRMCLQLSLSSLITQNQEGSLAPRKVQRSNDIAAKFVEQIVKHRAAYPGGERCGNLAAILVLLWIVSVG